MSETILSKEEYLERRKSETKTQVRQSLGMGCKAFDELLVGIGVDLAADKAQKASGAKKTAAK